MYDKAFKCYACLEIGVWLTYTLIYHKGKYSLVYLFIHCQKVWKKLDPLVVVFIVLKNVFWKCLFSYFLRLEDKSSFKN